MLFDVEYQISHSDPSKGVEGFEHGIAMLGLVYFPFIRDNALYIVYF